MNTGLLNDMNARFERAAFLQSGVKDMNLVARNTRLVPHWIDNTDCFWYRRKTQYGSEFRLVNAEKKINMLAFDHHLLAAMLGSIFQISIDPKNLPISGVHMTQAPLKVIFNAFGEEFIFDTSEGKCETSDQLDKLGLKNALSPDETQEAYVSHHNLYIKNLVSGEDKAMTDDGHELFSYGTTPISWGRPLNSDLQVLWSPDSKSILVVKTDYRKVNATPIINYLPPEGVRPTTSEYFCAYPGDEYVEQLHLIIIHVEKGKMIEANCGPILVNRSALGLVSDGLVWWSEKRGGIAYFVQTNRGEKLARVMELDAYSGKTRCVFEERSDTHVRLSLNRDAYSMIRPLPETDELIWVSERSGWAHLYLYDLKAGVVKNQITDGEWLVREVLHVDCKRREMFIQTCGRGDDYTLYNLDVCRVSLDSGAFTPIVEDKYEFNVINASSFESIICLASDSDCSKDIMGVAPSGDYFVATRSRVDEVPISFLFDRNGNAVLELETAELDSFFNTWHWPESVKLRTSDDSEDIYAVVFRPSDFSSKISYPVIDVSISSMELSGLPIGSFDNSEAAGVWYLQAAALSELGFIVVSLNGRGTVYRRQSFTDFAYGSPANINYSPDRICGIRQLGEMYPYMDLSKVGIMGFNGMPSAVFGLLQNNDFYSVGVSHALQDSRVNAGIIGEALLGITDSSAYNPAPEDLAENLKGKLLLMHGLLDCMDDSAATWRLVNALIKANKDFDMLILPDEEEVEHIESLYAFRRTWDYFVLHLLGFNPPKEFDLTTFCKC